ncbi:MAG: hypothetical protein ABI823_05565 [Bryobacteraceae bacterium]
MTLKNAAFLALIGSALAALLLTLAFITDLMGVIDGIVPILVMVRALVYAFSALSVTIFFYVFQRSQS